MHRDEARNFIIAHPMDSFFPAQGGGIRYLMNVLGALKELGWEVEVLGVKAEDSVCCSKPWRQIALLREGNPLSRLVPLWAQYLTKLYLSLPFLHLPAGAVILTHRIDCMLAFVLFKRKHPKVLVTAAPGYYLRRSHPHIYRLFGWIYHLAESACIQGVDAIIPTDEKTRSYFLERYPKAALVANIPSSIDLEVFKLVPREKARLALQWEELDRTVLFSGRLVAVKNIPLLIRAFDRVARQFPAARLVLVGDGEDQANIEALAVESSHRIELVGRVDPSAMPVYYAAADVLVLCSLEEGSPTVVKEALACGTPVVSTDVGDAAVLLSDDPVLGCIVDFDEVELAQAIERYLASPASPEQRRTRNQVAEQFGTHQLGEKFNRVFNQVIEAKNKEL
ncbi:MAG: glycosyltransferase family 4 protein [Anaerolineales bacterium]|nr:glycosyltransferase family 4 protein [Anaerolineales bacterium]